MWRCIVSNGVGMAVAGLVSVLITPILLRGLGEFYFGLWALAASLLDYFGVLDMGIRWTLFRYVARLRGAGDRHGLNQVFATALAVTLIIAAVLAICTVPLASLVPEFLGLSGDAAATMHAVVLFLGLSAALAFPAQLMGAYLRGMDRFDLDNAGLIVCSLVRAAATVLVLRAGGSAAGVAAAAAAVAVPAAGLYALLTRVADPALRLRGVRPSLACARELAGFSIHVFVNVGAVSLRDYAGVWIVGRWVGIAAVAPFSIALRVMTYFRMLFQAVNGPAMSELCALDAGPESTRTREVFLSTTRGMALLSCSLGLLLVLDGRMLLRIWLGAEAPVAYAILCGLVAGGVAMFANEPSRLLVFAQARYHRRLTIAVAAESLSALALGLMLASSHGPVAMAYASVLPVILVRGVIQPAYALRGLQLNWREYLAGALARPLAVGLLGAALCVGIGRDLLVLHSLLIGALVLLVGVTSDERRAALRATRRWSASLRRARTALDKPGTAVSCGRENG